MIAFLSYGALWGLLFVIAALVFVYLATRHDKQNEENLKSLSEPVHSSTLGFSEAEIKARRHSAPLASGVHTTLRPNRRARAGQAAGRTTTRR